MERSRGYYRAGGKPYRHNADYYCSGGKTYRYKTHHEVDANHSIEEVQAYVKDLPRDAVVFPRNPESEVPYPSVQDFISTCRAARRHDGPFTWPNESMRFELAIAIAAHHLPPGYAMCIQNKRPVPQSISGKQPQQQHPPQSAAASSADPGAGEDTKLSGGGRKSKTAGVALNDEGAARGAQRVPSAFAHSSPADEKGMYSYYWDEKKPDDSFDSKSGVEVYYHGTSVHNLPHIMADGFRPGLGTGTDRVTEHYGVPVPGVYVSPSWKTASGYPM